MQNQAIYYINLFYIAYIYLTFLWEKYECVKLNINNLHKTLNLLNAMKLFNFIVITMNYDSCHK